MDSRSNAVCHIRYLVGTYQIRRSDHRVLVVLCKILFVTAQMSLMVLFSQYAMAGASTCYVVIFIALEFSNYPKKGTLYSLDYKRKDNKSIHNTATYLSRVNRYSEDYYF